MLKKFEFVFEKAVSAEKKYYCACKQMKHFGEVVFKKKKKKNKLTDDLKCSIFA